MASPGTFIHPGTLGGRLSLVAARASPATRSPASTAPPMAALSRRKRRRDALTRLSLAVLVSFIEHLHSKRHAQKAFQRSGWQITPKYFMSNVNDGGRHPNAIAGG